MGGRGAKSGGGGRGGSGAILQNDYPFATNEFGYNNVPSDYHIFPDEAAYSHEYKGDGTATKEFFGEHSNYDELISGMSDRELMAFRDWTRGAFMDGSQHEGWDNMRDSRKRMTQIYDDIIDRATLDEGIVVTRRASARFLLGKHDGTMDEFAGKEGAIIKSTGHLSTGAASQGLTIGDKSKRVEYSIAIPKGAKGAGMWVGDERINAWGDKQREFMVNRDALFEVGKTTYDKSRKIYTVRLKYVGKTHHDYGTTGRI